MADRWGKKECCGLSVMLLVLFAILILTLSVFSNPSKEENSSTNSDQKPPVNPGIYVGLALLGVFVFIAVVCLCFMLFKQGEAMLPVSYGQCLKEKLKHVLKPQDYTAKPKDITTEPLTSQPENTDHKLNNPSKECFVINMDSKCVKTKDGYK